METMIRVIHNDKYAGTVRASELGKMIDTGKIAAFCRKDGWVIVAKHIIRGYGGTYAGPERRMA